MKTYGDEIGLFWNQPIRVGRTSVEGQPREAAREKKIKIAPPPEHYELPSYFPELSKFKKLTLDLETYDPNLKAKGSGVYRKDGFIVGVGIKSEGWEGDYYPIAHDGAPNCDREKVFSWLRQELKNYKGVITGANLLYDGDWLASENVLFSKAQVRDVQWAEPLLNENLRRYNLESISQRWLGEGKRTNVLKELYGPDYIAFMHKTHPGHTKGYVMGDLDLPDTILDMQIEQLKKEDLYDLFVLESRLYHMLLHMRRVGVRVDLDAAANVGKILEAKRNEARDKMKEIVGFHVEVWSAASVAQAFKKLQLDFPKTKDGNPSFTQEWLDSHPHPIAELVREVRRCDKFDGTFVQKFTEEAINGRIHSNFNPLRSDEGGTVSGRFSSSNPNLQQVPVRDDFFGPLIRALFVPNEGCQWWSADYSQMEYRLLVHYAVLANCRGADIAAQMYRDNPETDFHKFASEITGLPRKQAKNINFGIVYGMGGPTLAHKMGCSVAESTPILTTYHTKMPFCKQIYRLASSQASNNGFVRTVLKRKRRFETWEPIEFQPDPEKRKPALPYEEALKEYGKEIRRAFTHKALNSVLQGSNADETKKAMVDIWEAGLVGPNSPTDCQLTVHDELDGSSEPGESGDKNLKQIQEIMRDTIKLKVPVLVSFGTGPNWAEAH